MQEFPSLIMSSFLEEVNTMNCILWSFIICICHKSFSHYLSSIHIRHCTQDGMYEHTTLFN